MHCIVAVSGGVDSVVLLHMLANKQLDNQDTQLVVAHFDHGIRDNSTDDAQFVRDLADRYQLPFEMHREELGAGASEERARDRRYAYLRSVARKYQATIVTAHHADDVIESIAINSMRGTGWRGLAVLNSPDIWRPLIDMQKKEIIDYANQNELQWREDATNSDVKYLRNELRQKLIGFDEPTQQLLRLYRRRQLFLAAEIDNETQSLVGSAPYSRYAMIMLPTPAAIEILRALLIKESGVSPLRPQLHQALHAIKTLREGKRYQVGTGVSLVFTKTHYIVEVMDKVVS